MIYFIVPLIFFVCGLGIAGTHYVEHKERLKIVAMEQRSEGGKNES